MSELARLTQPYAAILCDIWGVIHNGGALLPGARERLAEWKAAGKRVILITNAPRPARTVQQDLDRLGLPREAYDAITSGGEAGIAALRALGRPVGFLGTVEDRDDLRSSGVRVVGTGFTDLACTGLDDSRDDPALYDDDLARWADAGVRMHCLNPDRIVIHRGERLACAGALADRYEDMGGEVIWYGKPHAAIYEHALGLAGNPERSSVLAIGDGLVTDMLGAARFGIDALFVAGGIHAGEPFPDGFAAEHGLGAWRPIATVADLS